MRLILMGTGPFAVPTFDSLTRSQQEIVAVVTRPVPESRGRRKGPANPVRDLFASQPYPLLEPESVNDSAAIDALRQWQADLLVVCDFGQILAPDTLAAARLGGINLHGSLLPKYRGAAPINWAIWNGEPTTGVTVIHMSPRLDAGPCLVQLSTDIEPDENAGQLEQRLSVLGVDAVDRALQMLENWDGSSPLGAVQDPALATRAPRLSKKHGHVDWTESAQRISNQVRALSPWPGTYTQWHRAKGDLRLILCRVSVAPDQWTAASQSAQPGQVLHCDEDQLIVATGHGALAIHEVQPAGKRALGVGEFLRGYPAQVGTVQVS